MRLLELRWAIGRDYQPTRPRGMEAWRVATIIAGRKIPIVTATWSAAGIGRVHADGIATGLVDSPREYVRLRVCGGMGAERKAGAWAPSSGSGRHAKAHPPRGVPPTSINEEYHAAA
jgi:hypothetical protein